MSWEIVIEPLRGRYFCLYHWPHHLEGETTPRIWSVAGVAKSRRMRKGLSFLWQSTPPRTW